MARFKKNEHDIHFMVSPEKRRDIIHKINTRNYIPLNINTHSWWSTKHHPTQHIPTNIYLLGDGKLGELFERYNQQYNPISKKNFYDYVREMIKQGLMYITVHRTIAEEILEL